MSTIVSGFKGKGDATICNNFRGLKMLKQIMKIVERILDRIIRTRVDINSMQFGFIPGRSTTDAIYITPDARETSQEEEKCISCLCGPGKGL